MNSKTKIGEMDAIDMRQGKGTWRKVARMAFVGLAAVSMVSCLGTYTGGGTMDSVAGGKNKATFGFMIEATDPLGEGFPTAVEGQFEYSDRAAGVRFHVAEMEPAYYAELITSPRAYIEIYTGVYTCAEGTGLVDFGVGSDQQDGSSDAVSVRVYTGPYAGYYNSGLIKDGNIQFKPTE